MQINIILGIDPGLENTGWGVLAQQGNRLSYVASGTIKTNPKQAMAERLALLYSGMEGVITEYKPTVAGVEEVFVNKNARTSLKLGQARGICLLVPTLAGVIVKEFSALEVKKNVVGYGKAEKHQVAAMIQVLLPKAQPNSADAADALAVAICTAHGG